MIKRLTLFLFAVIAAFASSSCGRAEEPRKITPVRYLEAEPGFGTVELSWINPRNAQLSHVDVSYGADGGTAKVVKVSEWNGDPATGVSEGMVSIPMEDLLDHEFTLVAVTRHGIASEPVKVVSHALAEPRVVLLGSIRLTPDFGGIRIGWTYPYSVPLTLKVGYSAGGAAARQLEFDAVELDEALIGDLAAGVPVILTMSAVTADGGTGEPLTATRTPFAPGAVAALSKSGWSVASLSDEQPGGNYSSARAIDGDESTYWHTQTNPEPLAYPHWIAVDMGAEKAVSRFSVFRDPSSAAAGTPAEYIVYVGDDGKKWTEAGRYAFNPDARGEQVNDLGRVWAARYFKLELTRDTGDYVYTYINEVSAYGFETTEE